MDGLTLLVSARAAGFAIERAGEKLRVSGPRSADVLATELIRRKREILALLDAELSATDPLPPAWDGVYELRRRAERSESLSDFWAATFWEVLQRWDLAEASSQRPHGDSNHDRLFDAVGRAMAHGSRFQALLAIDAWRDAWIDALGEPDLESTTSLVAADADRRARPRFRVRTRNRDQMSSGRRDPS